jgi:hypothetical protein
MNIFKKFKTKELIFIAFVAAFMFVFDLMFVTLTDMITGIPGAGFLVDTLFVVALATISILILRKFWVFTLIAVIVCALAIPTNILGPPGVYKLAIGFFLGFLGDLFIFLFRYRRIGYVLSITLANICIFPVMFFALRLLGLPGAEELLKSLALLMVIALVEGIVGAIIGLWLYERRIKYWPIIKQIQG